MFFFFTLLLQSCRPCFHAAIEESNPRNKKRKSNPAKNVREVWGVASAASPSPGISDASFAVYKVADPLVRLDSHSQISSPSPVSRVLGESASSSGVSTWSTPLRSVKAPITFGAKEWENYFGSVGTAPPLPTKVSKILNSACPFWPNKKVKDTHLLVLVPATVDGNPFTLGMLGRLVKNPKGRGRKAQYGYYGGDVKAALGNRSPRRSYWVLMTRDVLPDSFGTHEAQKELVAAHAERTGLPYEVPRTLEAATVILSHYTQTGERLYTDDPLIYARCREKVENNTYPVSVGGFSSEGLLVCSGYDVEYFYGVSCLRKF